MGSLGHREALQVTQKIDDEAHPYRVPNETKKELGSSYGSFRNSGFRTQWLAPSEARRRDELSSGGGAANGTSSEEWWRDENSRSGK